MCANQSSKAVPSSFFGWSKRLPLHELCADSKATLREKYIAFFNPLLGPAPGHDATTRNQDVSGAAECVAPVVCVDTWLLLT
jgi:hypothetical protein